MLIRKLASAAAVATLALAGPAFAAGDMEDSSPDKQGAATQYDSTDKQATNQQHQGAQDVQMTVKEVDRTNNKVTFEADLSAQAAIQGENQEKLQLSQLSEGDEVRASFDPLTGDITKLEVVKKGESGMEEKSPDIVPGSEDKPSEPSEQPGTTW